MSAGTPLTDVDREPWLRRIRAYAKELVGPEQQQSARDQKVIGGIVVACSALKKSYRDLLRGLSDCDVDDQPLRTYFVFIEGSRDLLVERLQNRQGHFMKVGMLDSQLDSLEDPTGEEDVLVVSMHDSTEEQVKKVCRHLRFATGLHE
jgi:gluconokinase